MRMLHQIINFFASIAFLFPLVSYLFVHSKGWIKNRFMFRLFSMLCGIASVGLFLMRRAVPQEVLVKHTKISMGVPVKIALISDLHLGLHKNEQFAQKIVDRLNGLSGVNYVFVAGDWTYYPLSGSLEKLYSPFKELNIPVYGVLGNHDVQKPGPDLRSELEIALEKNHIKLLQNEVINLSGIQLVGLGEYMNGENDVKMLAVPLDLITRKRIVLSHNPDVTLDYDSGSIVDLTLVGHTHCGQIKLFGLEKYVMPTMRLYQDGYSVVDGRRLFITCGLGEVMLPMRWGAKPSIDIIDLHG